MAGIPTDVGLTVDLPDDHVVFSSNQPLGSAEAVVSRGLGSFAPLDGDHATMVTNGTALGVSARVSGLRSVDAYFGEHPRGTVRFAPGGQGFVVAGQSGDDRARLDISNLPATLSFDLDPAARTLGYESSAVVAEVRAAYVNVAAGPTVTATVVDLPSSLAAGWRLGEQAGVTYRASSAIPRVDLFAAATPIEALQPATDRYLSARVTDIPAEIDLSLDLAARHLAGDSSAPLGGVDAVARFPVAGRDLVAVLDLAGVPASFDADFGDGSYRFRGLSGPLGTASLAVTNHAGTTVPTGQHLAVGFDQRNGDFDASVSASQISHVEYSSAQDRHTVRLDIAETTVAVDADVILTGGGTPRALSLAARVTGVPNTVRVSLAGGVPSYSSDRPLGIAAEARFGTLAALQGLGAPLFDNGIAVRARGCTSATQCAAIVGTVNLPSLPTDVAVDLANRTVSMSGYQGPSTLRIYLSVVDSAQLTGAALATLTGIPSALSFGLADTTVGSGAVNLGYTGSADIASLDVRVESTGTSLGALRGRAFLAPVPASVSVAGIFGSDTNLQYTASTPIDQLTVQATGPVGGAQASGLFQLTDIPGSINLRFSGFDDARDGFQVPPLTYAADASTLDGLVQVDAALAFDAGPVDGADDLYLVVQDLAASTTIQLMDSFTFSIRSGPGATPLLRFGGGLRIGAIGPITFNEALFSCVGGFVDASLRGTFQLAPSRIGSVDFYVTDVRDLTVLPGNTRGALPPAVGLLFPGIEGTYGQLSLSVKDVDLKPTADLTFRADREIGPDVFNDTVELRPTTSVQFHRYDGATRRAVELVFSLGPWDPFHLTIDLSPGHVPPSTTNTVTLRGVDGEQMLSLLDAGDQLKDYILNIVAWLVRPFGDEGGGGGGGFNAFEFFCDVG